ncbi:hypothetical protein FF1_011143 [Malus domestica]
MRGADEPVAVAVDIARVVLGCYKLTRSGFVGFFWRRSTTGSRTRPPSFAGEKESSPDFVNSRPKMEAMVERNWMSDG